MQKQQKRIVYIVVFKAANHLQDARLHVQLTGAEWPEPGVGLRKHMVPQLLQKAVMLL